MSPDGTLVISLPWTLAGDARLVQTGRLGSGY